MTDLRAACIHGRYDQLHSISDGTVGGGTEPCPGGLEITIDYEAAARWTHAEMVRRGPTDLTWEAAYPEEQADHLFLALGAINAALGDDKTVEELRAAALDLVDVAIGDTDG